MVSPSRPWAFCFLTSQQPHLHPFSPFVLATWTSYSLPGVNIHFPNRNNSFSQRRDVWAWKGALLIIRPGQQATPGQSQANQDIRPPKIFPTRRTLSHLRAFTYNFSLPEVPSQFSFFKSQLAHPRLQKSLLWLHRLGEILLLHTLRAPLQS